MIVINSPLKSLLWNLNISNQLGLAWYSKIVIWAIKVMNQVMQHPFFGTYIIVVYFRRNCVKPMYDYFFTKNYTKWSLVIEKLCISVTNMYVVVKIKNTLKYDVYFFRIMLTKIYAKFLSSDGIRESRKISDRLITSKTRMET